MNAVGPKELATPAHAEEEEMSEDEHRKSRLSGYTLRTTLSLANRDHEKGKCHATKGSLLERPKRKPKHSGPVVGAWWRSNLRKGYHLRIK